MTKPNTMIKAHGTGNDFLIYCDADGSVNPTPREVRELCDRHFGLGADGLIRVTKPQFVDQVSTEVADECGAKGVQWFMDYRNADGSLAEMCGNGTRATALFAQHEGLADADQPFMLGTRAGVKMLSSLGAQPGLGQHVFRVDMGGWSMGELYAYTVSIPGQPGQAPGTFVDMGNPHVVAVIEDAQSTLPVIDDLDLTHAPKVEPQLDHGQNVEFVRIDDMDERADQGEATMRVYERGCGETLSCGTGLCATAITLRARTGINHWRITVAGGILDVAVTDNDVQLTGNAELVATVTLMH
ncbi:diaminopimelate epimerase [Bifidobacterium gallicum]|uniref:Diaminopimelate epimerase n=1 Tax=Bifidobacterium gallicum DSM 20093 = LMG 11596 TaxID=561180 RepID=D1NTK2_9BIFI|nr:diaminopimelate epimerase [Bifidobacterium gallicum]EFA23056.1 diaminopimelate epimerase [Bifidobacterium gallicum DSM 20093 = LMG 11596]KFI57642.1 diaminopimelate epimerase [Bifidobacterium gallicum DSM 20093 = LMG 11596]